MLARTAIVALLVYLAVCAAMYVLQDSLLFHPSTRPKAPVAYGLDGFHEVRIPTSDGVSLTGWLHEAADTDKAAILFYGNADALPPYAGLFRRLARSGYTVLGVNYRGYGGSEGEPSEDGLYRDADAALALIIRRVPAGNVTLIGRSIGSGVAVDLAARQKVRSLVLVSPYTSIVNLAAEMYPFLPVRALSRFSFSTIDKIAVVKAPLLVVHGDLDQVIPLAHGRAVFAAANEPKRMEVFAGEGHNDIDLDRLTALVLEHAER